MAHHHLVQCPERDEVGDDHEPVEKVGELPDQIHLKAGARGHERHGQDAVDAHAPAIAEKAHVLRAEEVPAHNGGEGEKEEAHGHEDAAEAPHVHGIGGLGQANARGLPGAGHKDAGNQDDHGREGDDHKGGEDAEDSHQPLLAGMFHSGHGMGVRGGAHAGLVGEEAARHAVAHGLADADARRAAKNGLRIKGRGENEAKGRQDGAGMADEHIDAARDVEDSHGGHELFRHTGDAPHTAEKDQGRQRRHHGAHEELVHAQGAVERLGNGVGLHHVADEAQGHDDGNGEKDREWPVPGAHAARDVPGRSAHHMALAVGGFVDLGQNGLGKDGRHAEKGRQPEPEERPRPPKHHGRGRASHIARAHLGGNGRGQGLKGAHAALVRPAPEEAGAAHEIAQGKAELAYLHETQAQGIEQARAAQKRNEEERAPEKAVEIGDPVREGCHGVLAAREGGSAAGPRQAQDS